MLAQKKKSWIPHALSLSAEFFLILFHFFPGICCTLIILVAGVSHVLVHLVFIVMLWMLSLFPLTDNGLGSQTLPSVMHRERVPNNKCFNPKNVLCLKNHSLKRENNLIELSNRMGSCVALKHLDSLLGARCLYFKRRRLLQIICKSWFHILASFAQRGCILYL